MTQGITYSSSLPRVYLPGYHGNITPFPSCLLPTVAEDLFKQYNAEKKRPKILLVEDAPFLQKTNQCLLEALNCDVDIAKDGKNALRFPSHYYDLIFLDIDLPDMSGIQVYQHILNRKQNKKPPVIALTLHGEEMRKQCFEAGMNDFVTKPASLQQLAKLLIKWIPWYDMKLMN